MAGRRGLGGDSNPFQTICGATGLKACRTSIAIAEAPSVAKHIGNDAQHSVPASPVSEVRLADNASVLKGGAATIGAEALAEAARVAEQACQAGHTVDLEALQSVITRTRHTLLESGVPAPAIRGEDGVAGPADSTAGALSQAQRAILQRMLLLLEGSDMSVFAAMDELLAEDPSQRGTALDQAIQMMDFAQAGALVREALHD